MPGKHTLVLQNNATAVSASRRAQEAGDLTSLCLSPLHLFLSRMRLALKAFRLGQEFVGGLGCLEED